MKLSRQNPSRRNAGMRLPGLVGLLPALLVILLLGLVVAAWMKGGEQPLRSIEQPVPDERLAR